jgi:hypothetical protein
MMSEEHSGAVKIVYRSFLDSDYRRKWTSFDEALWILDYLEDTQLVFEAEIQIYQHSLGNMKCNEDHGNSICIVPQLIEAVNVICELFMETKELHVNNRYVLQNYLAAAHEKLIFVD